MAKVKNKLNSRNTKNPYDLISGVELRFKYNKNIKVSIVATKFDYRLENPKSNKGKRNLYMTDFTVNRVMRSNKGSDFEAVELFKRIENFARKCKNPLEVITLFVDAYKSNKEALEIKFYTCKEYSDSIDGKFVYNSLVHGN